MTTVTLTDPAKATNAGAWAVTHIGYKYWKLEVRNPMHKPAYDFQFKNKKDATIFALKWL